MIDTHVGRAFICGKAMENSYCTDMYLHFFSINWCSKQDFPVPAFPMTKNLNRKSEESKTKKKNPKAKF